MRKIAADIGKQGRGHQCQTDNQKPGQEPVAFDYAVQKVVYGLLDILQRKTAFGTGGRRGSFVWLEKH